MVTAKQSYAARLDIDYPEKLDRVTSFFRMIWIIPIAIVLSLLSAVASWTVVTETGETITRSSGGIAGGLFAATMLMIVFRERYPRWWFDFARELARFAARVWAYAFLLTDQYPSTEDEQSVHVEIDYPDVEQDLNRWLPLVKWLLAIPHYIALLVLAIGAIFALDHRLVRDPLHRTLSTGTLRLRGGGLQMGPSSRGVRALAGHRPIPAVQPQMS